MIRYIKFSAIAFIVCCIVISTSITPIVAKSPDWIVRSDMSAELLSKAIAAEDCEKKLTLPYSLRQINPAFKVCRKKGVFKAVQTLEQKLGQAKNPELRFDLEILLKAGRQRLRSYGLYDKYRVPYFDLSKLILESFEATLDEIKSPQKQRQAILKKLKQYAGLEPDTQALTSFLIQGADAQLQKSEFALPQKDLVEEDLDNNASQIYEILSFLRQQEVPNYQEAYEKLKTQLFDYETFVRREILTRMEDNYRLPAELYAFELERQGIEMPIEELIQQAHTAFTQIQQQMDKMAQEIAQQRGIEISDYREMIQMLKKEQLSPKKTLKLYQKRAEELEAILKREDLVTLPKDKFDLRLATAEEKKRAALAFYHATSNTVVLLVFSNPKKAKIHNDINNSAASWGIMAHEGRPGHDLQFATVQNLDLSRARTDFLQNASITEGWASYAELMIQPYLPLEAQFMSLRLQLTHAAKAFLEPELQLDKITIADVLEIRVKDLGLSRRLVEERIEKYTNPRFPGQAPAYFYGSQQLLQLRSQAEEMLGQKFTLKKFHDFVLSQGFLTLKLLEQVLQEKMG